MLLRVDLNVPLRDEPVGAPQVADDTCIRAALSARERTMDAERRTLQNADIPDGWIALDIGPRTAARFARACHFRASKPYRSENPRMPVGVPHIDGGKYGYAQSPGL